MKRMNDVFDLPMKGCDVGVTMSYTSADDDNAVANAINHVDALADALDYLIQNADGKVNMLVLLQANDALDAYRGEA